MKKSFLLLITFSFGASVFSQNENDLSISDFEFSNNASLQNDTSPAFVLLEEAPTEVYVPENLKALTIHTLNNFLGESFSIEVNPYFLRKRAPSYRESKNRFSKKEIDSLKRQESDSLTRTFYRYIGIKNISSGFRKQNAFSGIRSNTTISAAYVNKRFEGFEDERRTYSIGIRTKLIRLHNLEKAEKYYIEIGGILADIDYPNSLIIALSREPSEEKQTEMINEYFNSEDGKQYLFEEMNEKKKNKFEKYKKPLKPWFQVDGALGYSILFEENSISSTTLDRFGAWLTPEFSLQVNSNKEDSKTNNYINAFAVLRYVEDGFNSNDDTLFYRDFGGKIELEVGKFSFGYEYIKRSGSVESERSVGNIKFLINKDVSLTGGFGKDFSSDENLVTLFGVNWGLNFGSN